MDKEIMEKLAGAVNDLKETITARFASPDPKKREEETQKLVDNVLSKLSEAGLRKEAPKRKMTWALPNQKVEEGQEKIQFRQFLKGVYNKDTKWLKEVGLKAPTGMNEGTDADGGYTVPTEFATEIIRLERIQSIARSICRNFPMGTLTRKVPKQLTNPNVYWVGESSAPSAKTKVTLGQVTQTAKKVIGIAPLTNELLEDNNVNIDDFLIQVVAEAVAREVDRVIFAGDVSGASDPFNGVLFASGVNSVSLAGATLAYKDLISLYMSPKAPYRLRGKWVLSGTALEKIMKLVDDNNRPIWTMPVEGAPGRIIGKSYFETDQIPDTLGTGSDQTGILFGAFDQVWISDRGEYRVSASESASDSAGASAFELDEIWYRFIRRMSLDVANAEALSKLLIPAA